MMKRLPLILFCICALVNSCAEQPVLSEFSEIDIIRMEVAGQTVLVYNPKTCQMAFNRDRCEFRVHTDTMSDYFIVRMSEIPSELGQEVSADLTWTTSTDIRTRKNVTLLLVNMEGDRLWLWDAAGKTGMEVRILE